MSLKPQEPSLEQVVKALDRAAELVARPSGWCQGDVVRMKNGSLLLNDQLYQNPDKEAAENMSFCILGATQRACHEVTNISPTAPNGFDLYERAHSYLFKALIAEFPNSYINIPTWNDNHKRKQKDVVALVKKARDVAQAELTAKKD